MTWIDTITVVISVLLGIGICFLPNSASEWIATKASLHSFGIRNLPRKNDKTDTLANTVLFFFVGVFLYLLVDTRYYHRIYFVFAAVFDQLFFIVGAMLPNF